MPSLGAVSFPNSGAPAAQADFLRGVAWLHSFGYEDAIDAFRAAQKIDPVFAMAYWGEAMSFSQPLWFFEEVEKGRAALAQAGRDAGRAARESEDAARAGLPARRRSVCSAPGDKRARDAAHSRGDGGAASRIPGRR